MKKLISLMLSGLLLFSLVACEKSQNESTTSEKDTSIETRTEESSSEVETSGTTSEPEEEFHLFDEDMVADFKDYKPCEYEDEECIIKAKIPDSWSYELYLGGDGDMEHEASPDCGLNLYKGETNIENRVIHIIRSKFTSYCGKKYDNWEKFKTVSSLQGGLNSSVYNDNTIQAYIFLYDLDHMSIFIDDIDVKYFEENKQEIFNVLNSIEITKKVK